MLGPGWQGALVRYIFFNIGSWIVEGRGLMRNKIWLFRRMSQEALCMGDILSTRSREGAIYQWLIWAVGKREAGGGVYKVKIVGRE
jgi:hypothetical protein